MKPFDLEKAKAGALVCTRDGRPVRILCFDARNEYPIIALVNDNGYEGICTYFADGKHFQPEECRSDLMMAPVKKTGWMNVYKRAPSFKPDYAGSYIYSTKQGAIDSTTDITLVDTIKIEWEE